VLEVLYERDIHPWLRQIPSTSAGGNVTYTKGRKAMRRLVLEALAVFAAAALLTGCNDSSSGDGTTGSSTKSTAPSNATCAPASSKAGDDTPGDCDHTGKAGENK
jgi:hypothetical protein